MVYEKKITRKGKMVYKFEEGGISEKKYFYITKGEQTEKPEVYEDGYVCEDSFANECRHTDENGITPYGVKAVNEGGHNVTIVCLQCVIEAYNQLKLDGEID